MAKWFGFGPPFLAGSPGQRTVLPRQANGRLIRNDLLQLLLTAPGERVMRPDFGSQLRPTLFELIDQITIDELEDSIRNAIERFEPRVKVADIRIRETDDNRLDIKVFGSFNIDRFNRDVAGGTLEEANLLIELDVPTRTTSPGLT